MKRLKKFLLTIISIVIILFLILFVVFYFTLKDADIDPGPPIELTKKYELYTKDVKWKNIVIFKKEKYVSNIEEESIDYEPGSGLAICYHVKEYYVSKEKNVIVANNGNYLCIDTEMDKIVFKNHDINKLKEFLKTKYNIKKIKFEHARKWYEFYYE